MRFTAAAVVVAISPVRHHLAQLILCGQHWTLLPAAGALPDRWLGVQQVLPLFLALDRMGMEHQTTNRQMARLVGGAEVGQISLQRR